MRSWLMCFLRKAGSKRIIGVCGRKRNKDLEGCVIWKRTGRQHCKKLPANGLPNLKKGGAGAVLSAGIFVQTRADEGEGAPTHRIVSKVQGELG